MSNKEKIAAIQNTLKRVETTGLVSQGDIISLEEAIGENPLTVIKPVIFYTSDPSTIGANDVAKLLKARIKELDVAGQVTPELIIKYADRLSNSILDWEVYLSQISEAIDRDKMKTLLADGVSFSYDQNEEIVDLRKLDFLRTIAMDNEYLLRLAKCSSDYENTFNLVLTQFEVLERGLKTPDLATPTLLCIFLKLAGYDKKHINCLPEALYDYNVTIITIEDLFKIFENLKNIKDYLYIFRKDIDKLISSIDGYQFLYHEIESANQYGDSGTIDKIINAYHIFEKPQDVDKCVMEIFKALSLKNEK